MATINLFGASGHSRVVMDIICSQGNSVCCLYDDSPHYESIHQVPIFNASESVILGPLIISIGNNKIRKLISERYSVDYAIAVHPSAILSPYSKIGEGSVVMQGVILQSDVTIGKHCIINTGASVDHECVIGNFVHISPHATLCGNVKVGEGSWIGAGSVVIPGVKIGKWCTIGAGSIVIRDIPDNSVAFGNPCKVKSQRFL